MSDYGGIDMKLSKSNGKMGNKAAPRSGAAKGQGNGMGGYNAGAVNRAVRECGGAAPKYFNQGSAPASAGK